MLRLIRVEQPEIPIYIEICSRKNESSSANESNLALVTLRISKIWFIFDKMLEIAAIREGEQIEHFRNCF